MEAEARAHAASLVDYFEHRVAESDSEHYQRGLSTAREWLRLIDAEAPSQAELSAFIGIVHANRYRSSGWFDLALGAHHWARAKGVPVPPHEVFFASDGLSGMGELTRAAPLDLAQALLALFEQYSREDPGYEGWAAGLATARDWMELIQAKNVSRTEAAAFVERVFREGKRFASKLWYDASLAICVWCKAIGYPDLIPGDTYRLWFAATNDPEPDGA